MRETGCLECDLRRLIANKNFQTRESLLAARAALPERAALTENANEEDTGSRPKQSGPSFCHQKDSGHFPSRSGRAAIGHRRRTGIRGDQV
jgi:hypothetical protein